MTATQNSIEAYVDLKESGELGKSQKQIFEFIRKYPNCSYNDIARVLHLHHNTVTARIKELRDDGYIICCGSKIDAITKKSNNIYRVRKVGENPDVVINESKPILPQEMLNFLKKAVRNQSEADTLEIIRNGTRFKAEKNLDGKVSFDYGEFFKLSEIKIVCEDSAHNQAVISGLYYTVKFRLN